MKIDDRFVPKAWRDLADQELVPMARKALEALAQRRCAGSDFVDWFDYPRRDGGRLVQEIQHRLESVDMPYNLIVVIGIGGSYLGTRAVHDALVHSFALCLADRRTRFPETPMVFAGESLSEASLLELLDLLESYQPIMVVVSKSGTTTEPAVAFRVLRSYWLSRFGVDGARDRTIVVTDPNRGILRSLAQECGYLAFDIPEGIGGRYSVLSAVGLVPLALAHVSIAALVAGGDAFFREILEDGTVRATATGHPVLRYAALRAAAYSQGKKIELLALGEPKLRHFGEWWKQLFGESEGKQGRGLFPSTVHYTTDLHSMGQYVQEGERHLFETFLSLGRPGLRSDMGVERSLSVPITQDNRDQLGYIAGRTLTDINQTTLDATRIAHADGGVPCIKLSLDRLDESTLGYAFAFFETACAVSGIMLGVNPFDQPGVESYKTNLFALLGRPGTDELGETLRKRLEGR